MARLTYSGCWHTFFSINSQSFSPIKPFAQSPKVCFLRGSDYIIKMDRVPMGIFKWKWSNVYQIWIHIQWNGLHWSLKMHIQMLTKYSPLECCLVWKWIHSFLQQMGLPCARHYIRCRRCAGEHNNLVSVLLELTFQWTRQIINCKEANQYINEIIPVCNPCYEGHKQGQGWGKRRDHCGPGATGRLPRGGAMKNWDLRNGTEPSGPL